MNNLYKNRLAFELCNESLALINEYKEDNMLLESAGADCTILNEAKEVETLGKKLKGNLWDKIIEAIKKLIAKIKAFFAKVGAKARHENRVETTAKKITKAMKTNAADAKKKATALVEKIEKDAQDPKKVIKWAAVGTAIAAGAVFIVLCVKNNWIAKILDKLTAAINKSNGRDDAFEKYIENAYKILDPKLSEAEKAKLSDVTDLNPMDPTLADRLTQTGEALKRFADAVKYKFTTDKVADVANKIGDKLADKRAELRRDLEARQKKLEEICQKITGRITKLLSGAISFIDTADKFVTDKIDKTMTGAIGKVRSTQAYRQNSDDSRATKISTSPEFDADTAYYDEG